MNFLTTLITGRIQEGYRVIHLVLDNGSTHRPKFLATWIAQQAFQAEIVLHWLPVRSSWLNQVEIFFSLLQGFVLAPNCIENAGEAVRRMLDFIELHNVASSPFQWRYTSDDLRAKYGMPPRALPPPAKIPSKAVQNAA